MSSFNLNKVVLELEIGEENYIATVDVKTVAHYKKENKSSFLQDIQKVGEMDEEVIIKLLGSIVRKSEKSAPVGVKFFEQYNPLAVIEQFTPVLVEVLGLNAWSYEWSWKKVDSSSQEDIDLDYLYYIATTMLGWTEEQFFSSTIKHIMKQINIHMKINNPDARDKVENKETNSKGKVENSQVFTVLD